MESRPEPSHTTPTAAPTGRSWPRRYNLVGLCFLSTFICYIDRVNISVAIIPMAEEFGWDQTPAALCCRPFSTAIWPPRCLAVGWPTALAAKSCWASAWCGGRCSP